MRLLKNEGEEVAVLLERGLWWKLQVLLLEFTADGVLVTEDEVHLEAKSQLDSYITIFTQSAPSFQGKSDQDRT